MFNTIIEQYNFDTVLTKKNKNLGAFAMPV